MERTKMCCLVSNKDTQIDKIDNSRVEVGVQGFQKSISKPLRYSFKN